MAVPISPRGVTLKIIVSLRGSKNKVTLLILDYWNGSKTLSYPLFRGERTKR
jgi:hypothetical protein